MHSGAGTVVLVNGLPGAGKTTLARSLAARLGYPLLSKDLIKESLFETLGWSDRERSRTVGAAAMELVWTLLVDIPGDVIVESIFRPETADRVRAAVASSGRRHVLEILCECPGELALSRFFARIEAGERHPGHGHDDPAEFDSPTSDWQRLIREPLVLGLGPLRRVDTTKDVDTDSVAAWVLEQLPRSDSWPATPTDVP